MDNTMPKIQVGDIIRVYSAHESAWGKPACTYIVKRIDSDGNPVSSPDCRHTLHDVVAVSRSVNGKDFTCIWEKENYEIEPWGRTLIDAYAANLSEETKTEVAKCMKKCADDMEKCVNKNREAFERLFSIYFAVKVADLAKQLVERKQTNEG